MNVACLILRGVRALRYIDGPRDYVFAFFAASAASLHPRSPGLGLRGLRGFASSTIAGTASARPSRLRFIVDGPE
jgi:hypothetical protein